VKRRGYQIRHTNAAYTRLYNLRRGGGQCRENLFFFFFFFRGPAPWDGQPWADSLYQPSGSSSERTDDRGSPRGSLCFHQGGPKAGRGSRPSFCFQGSGPRFFFLLFFEGFFSFFFPPAKGETQLEKITLLQITLPQLHGRSLRRAVRVQSWGPAN